MKAPLWVLELAAQFWQQVGQVEPLPRTLKRSVARALPLGIVLLPTLTLQLVRDWLTENGHSYPGTERDRPLRGCLFARHGTGFIFLDGTDAEEEQRFSLAHELAHYLRDYWQPRQQLCAKLGDAITAVLDGLRSPTTAERAQALLAHVELGYHVHLLQRGGDPRVARAEEEADRLAFELLAPLEEEALRMDANHVTAPAVLAELLLRDFGLPSQQARDYSAILLPTALEHPLLRRWRESR